MIATAQALERAPVVVRTITPDDRGFVISSFLRSQRNEGDRGLIANDTYFAFMRPEAERIASGPVLIAHAPHDQWLILGWLGYEAEPLALSYAYTRFSFRRMGVFDSLLRSLPATEHLPCRHVGRPFAALRARYGFTYQPRST